MFGVFKRHKSPAHMKKLGLLVWRTFVRSVVYQLVRAAARALGVGR
jgi:hypothetical protein